ncbi:MAG: GTPase Era [Bacteroidia bacterium]|nr:GTPase Era [Bacteroidia bacterium]
MSDSPSYRSGFVCILGKPNAGKSTLLNTLLGQKLVIASDKPQTTRHRIFGIDSGEGYQIVYSDTPGLIRPKYKLQERMMGGISQAMEDADIMLLLLALNESFPEEDLFELVSKSRLPRLLVFNKTDLVDPVYAEERIARVCSQLGVPDPLRISALRGDGVPELKERIRSLLPEGPPYFDPEEVSDRPERFFFAELIREKIFQLTHEEVPYASEVEIVQVDTLPERLHIYANIHVERETQKGILIGKGGRMLRQIGTLARQDIEAFTGSPVHLEIHIKVSEGWKDSGRYLNSFGY